MFHFIISLVPLREGLDNKDVKIKATDLIRLLCGISVGTNTDRLLTCNSENYRHDETLAP